MREILFRGKRTDNGEWVEGRMLADDVIALCGQEFRVLLPENCFCADEDFVVYIVHPETVGQYTGLTDKHGKRIFEGDIVRFRTKASVFKSLYIRWNEKTAQFVASNQNGFRYYPMDRTWDYEILGNIHDNPELMKGEKT